MQSIKPLALFIGCGCLFFSASCAQTNTAQAQPETTQSARAKKPQNIKERRAASGRQMSSIQSGGAFKMGPGKYKPKQYVATLSYNMSVSSSFEVNRPGFTGGCLV